MRQLYETLRSQNVQIFGYAFHDTDGQNHCPTLKTQWFFLNEICMDTHLQGYCGKDSSRKGYWNWNGNKYRIGNGFFLRKPGLFLSVYVDEIIKMAGEKQNMTPMWKKFPKDVDLDGPTSFLDHVYLGCTQRECKPNETIL